MKIYKYKSEEEKNESLDEEIPENEPENEYEVTTDYDYIDVVCPKCSEQLTFLKSETNAVCPWCDSKINLK